MPLKKRHDGSNGTALVHRIFGESLYENLASLMDEQIAEMMKNREFRETVEEFNVRMFEIMAKVARKQMSSRH